MSTATYHDVPTARSAKLSPYIGTCAAVLVLILTFPLLVSIVHIAPLWVQLGAALACVGLALWADKEVSTWYRQRFRQ